MAHDPPGRAAAVAASHPGRPRRGNREHPTALLPPAYLACAEELTELASAGPATG